MDYYNNGSANSKFTARILDILEMFQNLSIVCSCVNNSRQFIVNNFKVGHLSLISLITKDVS